MPSALDYITATHTGRSAAKAQGVVEAASGKRYRVGGLLVTFTDTGNPDDSEDRDIFTPETDFCIADGQRTIVWYHHGKGKTIQKEKVGHGTLKRTPEGVWIDAVLEGEYAEVLYNAVERGDLGWSSGTVDHLVERTPVRCDDGGTCHIITHWPLGIDASLTPIPAFPNTATAYGAMKSLVDVADLADVELNPTAAQAAAGNYRKGHVSVHGLTITIENPKGSLRRGVGPDGPWENVMNAHYGYIKRTEGADGDHVDVFIGEDENNENVWIIDQVNADGTFDEHKVVIGVPHTSAAVKLYRSHYPDGWTVGPVSILSLEDFKTWLADGDTTKPYSTAPRSTKSQMVGTRRTRTTTHLTGDGAPGYYGGGTADYPVRDPYQYPTGPDPFGGQRGGGGGVGFTTGGGAGAVPGGIGASGPPHLDPAPLGLDVDLEVLAGDVRACVAAALNAARSEKEKAVAERVRERGGVFNGPAVVRLINLGYDLANYLEVPELGDFGRLEELMPAGASIDDPEWRGAAMRIVSAWWECMAKIARDIKREQRRRKREADGDELSTPGSKSQPGGHRWPPMSNTKNIEQNLTTFLVDAWWAPTSDRISIQNKESSEWVGNLTVDQGVALGIDPTFGDHGANNGYLGAYTWGEGRFTPLDIDNDGTLDYQMPGRIHQNTPPADPPKGAKTRGGANGGTVMSTVYMPTDILGEVKPLAGCAMIWDSHFGPEPRWTQQALLAPWSGGEREENPYAPGDVLPAGWNDIAVELASPSVEEIMQRAQLPRRNAEELLRHLYRCRRGEALAARRRRLTAEAAPVRGAALPEAKSFVKVKAWRNARGAVLVDEETGRFVDNVSVPPGNYLYDPETRNVYSDLPFLSGAMKKNALPAVQKVFCDASDPERACACWHYNRYGVAGPSDPSEIFEDLNHCKGSGIYYITGGEWRPAVRKESDTAIAARRVFLQSARTPGMQVVARASSARTPSAKCGCGCGTCGGDDLDEQEVLPRALEPVLLGWEEEWEGKALKTPRGADAGCWATVLAAFYRDSKVDAGDRILEAFATGEVLFPHADILDYIQRGKTFSGWTGKHPGRDYLPAEFRAAYKNWHSPSASADVLYRILLAYFNCLKTKLTAPPPMPATVGGVNPVLASALPSAKAVVTGAGLAPRADYNPGAPQGVSLPCWVEACQNMLRDLGENNLQLGRDVIEGFNSGAVPFPREWEQFARMRTGQANAIDAWLESHDPAFYVPSQYRTQTKSWSRGAGNAAFTLLMYYKRCLEHAAPKPPVTSGGSPAWAVLNAAKKSQTAKSQAVARPARRGAILNNGFTPGYYEGANPDLPIPNPYTGGAIGDGTGGVSNRDNPGGGGYGGGSGPGNQQPTPPKETVPTPYRPKNCEWPYENYGYPAPVFSEEQLQYLLDGGVRLSGYVGIEGNTDEFYNLGVDGEDGGLPDWERLLEAGIQRNNANPDNDHVDADDDALDSLKDQAIDDWKNYLKCCAEEFKGRGNEEPSAEEGFNRYMRDIGPQHAPTEPVPPVEEQKMAAPEDAVYWDEECWAEAIEGNSAPTWILRNPSSLPWAQLHTLYTPTFGMTRAEREDYADRTDMFRRIKEALQARQRVEDQELDDMGAVLDSYFSCWLRKQRSSGGIRPGGAPSVPLTPLRSTAPALVARKSLVLSGGRPLSDALN